MTRQLVPERLAVSLTVTINGTAHPISPGNVRRFGLDLWSWGLEGEVEFLVTDLKGRGGKEPKDALLEDFLKPDLAEVSLEVKAVIPGTSGRPKPKALKIKGLVSDKTLYEEPVLTGDSNLILHRRYVVRFMDPARLLWRQHHPCELYTKKTVQDVLDAHKGGQVSLDYDWAAGLGTAHPILFLGGLEPRGGASFYDWVLWYVHGHAGVFTYDYAAYGYALAAAKKASGTPLKLKEDNLAELEVLFPEVIRHDVTVLNAVAEGPLTQPLTQDQTVPGLRQDVLLCTPIADEVQARIDLETARLKARGPEVELIWASFPEDAGAFTPGTLVNLPDNPAWGAAGVAPDGAFRIRGLHLDGEMVQEGEEEVHGGGDARYTFHLRARLELKDEAHVDLPAWQPPAYPRYVEGLIVSEQGDDKDETWQAYSDPDTSLDQYQVKVPLFSDQVVPAPFNPNLLPGHFYFPAYKGERVLLGLDLQHAWVKRFLDWRAGVRMPQDGQGVQLMVGKTPENGTALKHFYTNDKPVFLMQRTSDKDTQKIQLAEGSLIIQVKEES
jgi:hypothetical protein